MGAAKIAAAVIVCIVIVAGGVWAFSMMPSPDKSATMIIDFTAADRLAGEQDAVTSAVKIYKLTDGKYTLSETVTMSTAAKASVMKYTTGEKLFLKLYDDSDTSICTQYQTMIVPQATAANVYDGAFQIQLDFTDKGDTAKDIGLEEANGTAIAASSTVDVTASGYDTAYATWEMFLRAQDSNTGYVNSYNFLKSYENNQYLVIDCSGTGWDSTVMLGGGWQVYDKADTRYFVKELDNEVMTRIEQSDGSFNPDGRLRLTFTLDLTGYEASDSVTFNYQYMWYSSFEHFKTASNWGADTAETAEVITIQY